MNSTTGVLYTGSLNFGKIVSITKTGVVSDFVRARQYGPGPICGIKVDTADNGLWVNVCPDDGPGAELVHIDSAGKLIERFQ